MKKFGLLIAVIMVVSTVPVQASKWEMGAIWRWYSPEFGEVNEEFNTSNNIFGTNLRFRSEEMVGFSLGYEVSENFSLGGELGIFISETSDNYFNYYRSRGFSLKESLEVEGLITVTPVIFSGTYKFSPGENISPYLGIGIVF